MAKNIQVLVNTGNPENNKTFEVVQGSGAKGKPTTIKAVKGARYQLEELTAKSTGPENIRSKRVGKNLHVMLDGSSAADLIVENYYDEDMLTENNRGLYGRAEDGKMYEYIPEDPTPEGLPINLADGGRPVSQVLGGLQIGEAFELSGLVLAAAGGGFGALTAGAAAVGAAALAGGGGGGGGATTDTAAAALASIKAAAENNTATSGNLAATVFTAAGVTGVDANNLAAIQSALDTAAVNGNAADTKEEVQAIVDAYNAIKGNADGTPNNNATNPTQAQYAAIGVTGVDTATEESLLGDAIDGKPFSAVDTVAEVQALADAAAAVIASTTGGTAPTQAQLVALGITGVTPANLAAVQAAIANNASGAAGVDTLSELQAVTDAATATAASNAALELIKNAAEGNTAGTTPSVTDFATAGITGVDAGNLAAISSALNSAAVNGAAADTKGEVQAIVDAYKAIKDNADTPATTNATAAQYTAVGVTGIDSPAKANLLGDVIDGKDFADVDTVPELQALATAAAAVIAGATGGTAPTQAQLNALGITGVTPANLAAVQAAIAATGNGGAGVDTLSELQTVVTNAAAAAAATAAALSTIAAAAQANDATNANVGTGVFATAGITGVDVNNIAAIQSALNDTDVQSGQADTAVKVQAVVDAYNAIKANADAAGTTNATQAQYAAIGVNGIDNAAKTSLLGDVVDTKAFADVDTVPELQALATAAAAVITGAAAGTQPTKAQLESLGITGVTDANLSAIQAAIAATADDGTGVDTLAELQAVANTGATNAANAAAAAAALSTIAAAAQANDATNTNVADSVFATAGVTGVDSTNVAAIQSALNSAAVVGTSVDTLGEVQAVVDAYKAILAEANDTANTAGNGTADANSASNPTAAQYAAIGVNLGSAATDAATDPETLALLNAIVGGKQTGDVDTVAEVQALATIANAIQLKANGGTPNPALTIADLQKIGLDTTGVTTDNLPALLAAIALKNDNGSETDTLEKLQALIGTLDKVAPVGVNDTSSATEDALIQTGNVKTNDTSLDTTETFAIVGSNVGNYGTLVLTSSGAYTYTYNTGIIHAITANVTDTFTYRVTDAAGNTSTATLAVTVTPVNDAATFSGDISKATSETNVAQTITGQLNVADIDSATTVVAQTNVAGSAALGKFTITTAGAWSYVMDNAQNQLKPSDVITDSLTVSTADGTTQTISVVITGTNDAPIVANALADTTATATVAITNYVVPANAFSDVDSTSLTYTATLADGSALSTVGLSFDATTRTVSGTPSAGTAGSTLSVKVTASDGSLSDFDTFDIVVASPDSIAPTLLSSSPADNGTVAYANVANDLTLTFSEAVQKGTGLIELYNASNTLVESFNVANSTQLTGWNGSTLTINPTADLAAGTGYYVKVATTAIKDLANNAYAGITDATTLNFTVSAGAGSVIDLGASGKLIKPVQVEGKWYYYWDVSGDSANTGTDTKTHDQLDAIFKYDINGVERPSGITDTGDVYRYATINGVQLALPTVNGNWTTPPVTLQGSGINLVGTSYSDEGASTNSTSSTNYDDLLAIWDAYNGTSVATGISGTPTNWAANAYWSASGSSASHNYLYLQNGGYYLGNASAETVALNVALQVVAANAAPVLADTALTLTGVSAGAAAPVNGTTTGSDLVSSLVGGISDADAGATKGIAITGVHSGATLYYSTNGGTTWTEASATLSPTNALLLAADTDTRVYYKANNASGTFTDAITFRAWDMTANITEGVYTDTTPRGGKAQFSTATDTVSVVSTLPMGATLDLGTVSGVRLNLIKKVEAPNGKIYYFVDLDGNGTPTGSDNTTHNALDTLFNGGADTTGLSNPIAGQDTERSVIVNGYTLVLPTRAEFAASLATGNTDWDVIYGWGPTILNFMTADPDGAGSHWASNNSGSGITTRSDPDTWTNGFVVEVKVPVAPVVLDLNRDGTFSYSQVAMDVNGSNHLSLTQWAGAQDGVLVWDKLGDGVVHDNSQYAFGQYATSTRVDAAGYNRLASDLDGLSDAFDTNHDGKFNAADAQFAQFSVWQDANQNGVSDAGEVRSLADWGITEINLVSDGVQRTPVAGVTEVGQSTATLADGSSMQVADALFAYNALDYTVTGNSMNLLGADMHLDLSSVVAVHSNVTAMDLTGTGANTVKLSLADVLSVATDASIANGVHKLTLTGDANDTVELDLSQWANTGNTVTEGDHTYAVYNASSAAAAQLLIDQHMVLANHG